MHFITGGAFNGKKAWVKNNYEVTEEKDWISAYQNQPLPDELTGIQHEFLILEGIEIWLKSLAEQFGAKRAREIWKARLEHWRLWEKGNSNRKLVVIGTDITKGIVPLGENNRLWRDAAGWAFQDTAAASDRVDVIWYGINQTIK